MAERPPTLGFQKPVSAPSKPVRIAVIQSEGNTIGCSCEWGYAHPREKVREEAAQRHLDKKHGGQGMWL